MCSSLFKTPKIPDAPDPVIIPPEQQKILKLNPMATKTDIKKKKADGTKKLQIPMGGISSGSGLSMP